MDRWQSIWKPQLECDHCGFRFPAGNGRFCSAWCWYSYFGWT